MWKTHKKSGERWQNMPALKISSPLISCKDELNVFEGLIKEGREGEGVFGGGWLQPAWQHAGRALSHTCSLQGPTGASTHCKLIRRTPQSTRRDLTGLWPAGSLLVRDPRSRRDELPGRQQGRIIPLALRVQVRTEFPRKPVHKRGI